MHLKLADIFSDNLVLQRDMPAPVWGWSAPGSGVEVRFAGRTQSAIADAAGRWEVRMDAMPASSDPRDLVVASAIGHQRLMIRNVVVGDVWICSGQSNMEVGVASSKNGAQEIQDAHHALIRLLSVPKQAAGRPQTNLGGAAWQVCTPAAAARFSAVGYFFGRELWRRLQAPVGLINSSWGGSVAEAWTSREGLAAVPELSEDILERHARDLRNLEALRAAYADQRRVLEERTRDTGNTGWATGWADRPSPPGAWQDTELPWIGLQSPEGIFFSGVLWFRKELELPAAWGGRDLCLALGACDDSDTAYFNNAPVGGVSLNDRPDARSFLREYTVPGRLVRPGKNVIAVRVHLAMYAHGLTGPAASMQLSCPALPGLSPITLAGAWRYAVEQNYGLANDILPPTPDIPHHVPAHLFNAMIAPLVPFAIRGVIWYQGEANCEKARQYRALFPALIQDWRRQWRQGDFPFLFVQLPNFNYRVGQKESSESRWAELREAQSMALRQPNTGMAVTIDIGEARNVHPGNKQDVGRRLALIALAGVYKIEGVVGVSPLFLEARRDGSALRVSFTHAAGGLVCRGKELHGFAVAGSDGEFVRAQARIEGNSILAWAPSVAEPKAVRYAWADSPAGNLYNAGGLPAAPFRSDFEA